MSSFYMKFYVTVKIPKLLHSQLKILLDILHQTWIVFRIFYNYHLYPYFGPNLARFWAKIAKKMAFLGLNSAQKCPQNVQNRVKMIDTSYYVCPLQYLKNEHWFCPFILPNITIQSENLIKYEIFAQESQKMYIGPFFAPILSIWPEILHQTWIQDRNKTCFQNFLQLPSLPIFWTKFAPIFGKNRKKRPFLGLNSVQNCPQNAKNRVKWIDTSEYVCLLQYLKN